MLTCRQAAVATPCGRCSMRSRGLQSVKIQQQQSARFCAVEEGTCTSMDGTQPNRVSVLSLSSNMKTGINLTVRGQNTAHLPSDVLRSCICRMKPQVAVDAAVSATQDVLCAALVEMTFINNTGILHEHFSLPTTILGGTISNPRGGSGRSCQCCLLGRLPISRLLRKTYYRRHRFFT